MSEITPEAVSERLENGDSDFVLLDIRPRDGFEEWHIPGSEHIDVYDELKTDPESATASLEELPRDSEIVTVCAAGKVSQTATEILVELGYDAKTLVDGMAGWSRVHRTAPVDVDIDGSLVQVARPGKGCLSHVLISRKEAAVFDASLYVDKYEAILKQHDAELVAAFDTHGHADHVSGCRRFADRHDVPYYLHSADALDVQAAPLEDGQTVTVGDVPLEVMHTPGHSPGGVTYDVDGEALLTGDTLFHESVGRVELGVEAGLEDTDVKDNAATLYESLQRLLDCSGDSVVLPAHDPGSPDPPVAAHLSEVVQRNSDLRRDREEFIDALSSDIPDHPPNFQRVKRINVGAEDVDDVDIVKLELGPNRCAAE